MSNENIFTNMKWFVITLQLTLCSSATYCKGFTLKMFQLTYKALNT